MARIALLQMQSGIDPAANAAVMVQAVADAAQGGCAMLFTPEMSALLDSDRARSSAHLHREEDDPTLKALCAAARLHGIWLHIGSLALSSEDAPEKRCNRGFVIDASGAIVARYDKMHLFDVDLPTGESWRESAAYEAGTSSQIVQTPLGVLGLSICYDIRFPALFQALSGAGASLLSIPAAFTVPTGAAHWHVLLRARAIENATFVIAAAQSGHHEDGRTTYGHSLVIDPWGTVLLDMEHQLGLAMVDLDLAQVNAVRARIPVIDHRRSIPPVARPPVSL
jgi:deaminated glutathione amidase